MEERNKEERFHGWFISPPSYRVLLYTITQKILLCLLWLFVFYVLNKEHWAWGFFTQSPESQSWELGGVWKELNKLNETSSLFGQPWQSVWKHLNNLARSLFTQLLGVSLMETDQIFPILPLLLLHLLSFLGIINVHFWSCGLHLNGLFMCSSH